MAYVQEDMRTINLATCPFAVCSYTTSTPSTSSSSSSPSSRSMPAIRARVTGFHDKSSKATCVVLRFFDRCEVGEWFLRLSDAAAMTDRQTRRQLSGRRAGLISSSTRLVTALFTLYSLQQPATYGTVRFLSASRQASTDTPRIQARIAHLLTSVSSRDCTPTSPLITKCMHQCMHTFHHHLTAQGQRHQVEVL